ncbi:MAG: LytTR family DNA-binding domain-containing protein [bacterium]|nr:LytTR family DNA-binding domain-containing protein [bacterium]
MKLAVCDDQSEQALYVKKLINKWAESRNEKCAVEIFENAEAFLFEYEENRAYDVIVLDIQMKKMNGIELAEIIRQHDTNVQIVFMSGYSDYIAKGYDVAALHYLMKPVSEEKFFEVLDKARHKLALHKHYILFSGCGCEFKTAAEDIMYAEAVLHYICIHTISEIFKVKMTMTELEKRLKTDFVRCHRSYIANIRYIHSITRTEITLDNGERLPVSNNKYNLVNREFLRYYRG